MLKEAAELGASDLHIRVGMPPMVRIHGEILPLPGYKEVSSAESRELVEGSITDEQRKAFLEFKSLDFSRNVNGVAHFRCAYFLQQGMMGMVYRRIPHKIPTLGEIQAPEALVRFSRQRRGLVLITGPTGSGKSTTLAAMLDLINHERAEHILTIEDPIEYVHTPARCIINQREVGIDAIDFPSALRAALREDPDVILLGEMRDLETTRTAITAAETGHLVLATLHTSRADTAISRAIDQFPADEQEQIRLMLSESLVGICTQALLPRADGRGRVAVHEVLVGNNPVRALIRANNISQLRSTMQTQSKEGMQTLDNALAYYTYKGFISEDVARTRIVTPKEFDPLLQALRQGKKIAVPRIVPPSAGHMAPVSGPTPIHKQSQAPVRITPSQPTGTAFGGAFSDEDI